MTVEEFQSKFGIIGKSKEIKDLVSVLMQVAESDITVLINGESGTGKEVFARAVHGASRRTGKNLVSVNCGAIPEGLLESELFGHEKGSFTGATDKRKGYFELADGGTLFLDEIGEMPLTLQVKLLRALETKEFMKVGAERITKVDVRIIAATNKDLQAEVEKRRFREDLYFRLKAVTLQIPPLRKRKGDIDLLTQYFIRNYCTDNDIPEPDITPDAMNYLREYSWPGNIRELKNTIETAIAMSRNSVLGVESFYHLIRIPEQSSSRNLPMPLNKSADEVEREFIKLALFELKKDIMDLKNIVLETAERKSVPDVRAHYENEVSDMSMKSAEKAAIIRALRKAKGNRRMASVILGISERTLYRKIEEYDIKEVISDQGS